MLFMYRQTNAQVDTHKENFYQTQILHSILVLDRWSVMGSLVPPSSSARSYSMNCFSMKKKMSSSNNYYSNYKLIAEI